MRCMKHLQTALTFLCSTNPALKPDRVPTSNYGGGLFYLSGACKWDRIAVDAQVSCSQRADEAET